MNEDELADVLVEVGPEGLRILQIAVVALAGGYEDEVRELQRLPVEEWPVKFEELAQMMGSTAQADEL